MKMYVSLIVILGMWDNDISLQDTRYKKLYLTSVSEKT